MQELILPIRCKWRSAAGKGSCDKIPHIHDDYSKDHSPRKNLEEKYVH